jgi:hypothetical protein
MRKLGKFKLSLKPWPMPEMDLTELEESEQFVDFAEEPRVYEGKKEEGLTLFFIDGVRRTEYAVYIVDEGSGKSYEGAFVSLGAGVMKVERGRLNLLDESFLECRRERLLFVSGDLQLEDERLIELGFKTQRTDGELSSEINRYMRESLEASIAYKSYKKNPESITICDGILSHKLKGTYCLGFVKTIKKLYLSPEFVFLLMQLKVGQRSPIIKLHYQRQQEEREKVDRYTWYVKLSPLEGMGSLARLEVLNFDSIDFERVRYLADLTAGVLPLFASRPFQDQRAPQNLLPIRSLEFFLRKQLGSYQLIRKRLEQIIYA